MNALRAWLDANPQITQMELAHRCGVTYQHINSISTGYIFPSLKLMLAIEEATDGAVSVDYWIAIARAERRAQRQAEPRRAVG